MPSSSLKYISLIVFLCMMLGIAPGSGGQDIIMTKVDLPASIQRGAVRTIYSCEDRFLWVGTASGLLKYSGSQFHRFTASWKGAEQEITAIGQDSGKMIWVGYDDGSIAYLRNNTLVPFEPEEGTSSRKITSLLFDQRGFLWWGTYGEGVYYYTGTRVYNINGDDGLNDEYVYDLIEDDDGKIWVATDAGVSSCSIDDGDKEVISYSVKDGLPDFIATSLFIDDKGDIWAGFDDHGFCRIDPSSGEITIPPSAMGWAYGPVRDLLKHKGTLWVSTRDHGLIELHPGMDEQPLRFSTTYLPQKHTGKIIEDGMGNLWILSDEGLYITSGIHFKRMTRAGDKSLKQLHSILVDRENRFWFSSDEGLFVASGDDRIRTIIPGSMIQKGKITSLAETPDGRICAASFGNGLYIIDPVAGVTDRITSTSGLVNDHILSLAADGHDIWLATLGGISRCTFPANGQPVVTGFSQKENLGNSYIYSVFIDSEGNLWFGTDGKGVGRYDRNAMVLYGESSGLEDNAIYSVAEDDRGNIWCTAASGQIYRFRDEKFVPVDPDTAVALPATYSIGAAGPYMVAVREGGIELFDTRTAERLLLNTEIGLREVDADLNSIYKDREGRLFIATQEGIIVFDPEDADFPMKPETVIESVSVFSVPLEMQVNPVLRYSENNISIAYSGLWFLAPGKVRYEVFLDGYDRERKPTFDHLATYPNLPPGDYRFEVTSWLGDSPGAFSADHYAFSIRSPFWARAWFIILAVLALMTGFFVIVRYRESHLRRVENQKKEKIEFEFQALKNQVNPHFLFNSFSTLISLIEEAPGKAVNYTEKLSDFFRKILQAKESDLILLSEEMEMIRDYMFILEERFGHNIRMEADLDQKTMKTYILPMTLQMLIENVMKHNVISREHPVTIRISRDDGYLAVQNNLRPKTTKSASTGLGLENIRKRYLLVTGKKIKFTKTPAHFIVHIPIIE